MTITLDHPLGLRSKQSQYGWLPDLPDEFAAVERTTC